MQRWDTVAIIGVGLLGGSLGLALKQRGLANRVLGWGRNPETLHQAQAAGIIDVAETVLADAVPQAEIIVICTPVDTVVETARRASLACRPQAVITDVASTKGRICRQLAKELGPRGVFLGGHPIAGSEKSGAAHARADLFEGRKVVLTPTNMTAASAIESLTQFWSLLGAQVAIMSPTRHDRLLAATSHLPHLLAAALAASTPQAGLPWTATGWKDTTRIAGGDAVLWEQILMSNRKEVLIALDRLRGQLDNFEAALSGGLRAQLRKLLQAGKDKRDAVGS